MSLMLVLDPSRVVKPINWSDGRDQALLSQFETTQHLWGDSRWTGCDGVRSRLLNGGAANIGPDFINQLRKACDKFVDNWSKVENPPLVGMGQQSRQDVLSQITTELRSSGISDLACKTAQFIVFTHQDHYRGSSANVFLNKVVEFLQSSMPVTLPAATVPEPVKAVATVTETIVAPPQPVVIVNELKPQHPTLFSMAPNGRPIGKKGSLSAIEINLNIAKGTKEFDGWADINERVRITVSHTSSKTSVLLALDTGMLATKFFPTKILDSATPTKLKSYIAANPPKLADFKSGYAKLDGTHFPDLMRVTETMGHDFIANLTLTDSKGNEREYICRVGCANKNELTISDNGYHAEGEMHFGQFIEGIETGQFRISKISVLTDAHVADEGSIQAAQIPGLAKATANFGNQYAAKFLFTTKDGSSFTYAADVTKLANGELYIQGVGEGKEPLTFSEVMANVSNGSWSLSRVEQLRPEVKFGLDKPRSYSTLFFCDLVAATTPATGGIFKETTLDAKAIVGAKDQVALLRTAFPRGAEVDIQCRADGTFIHNASSNSVFLGAHREEILDPKGYAQREQERAKYGNKPGPKFVDHQNAVVIDAVKVHGETHLVLAFPLKRDSPNATQNWLIGTIPASAINLIKPSEQQAKNIVAE